MIKRRDIMVVIFMIATIAALLAYDLIVHKALKH